jgi:hypothetical protein
MKYELFESFYNGNIEDIAKAVCKEHEDFCYQANVKGVFEEYLNQKTFLRQIIKDENENSSSGDLLDGHKIAACITVAIQKVRIIQNTKAEDSDEERFELSKSTRMNDQVALLSGISCLLEYMAVDKTDLMLDSENKICLRFPQTDYEKSSKYLDSLNRALYYTNVISSTNTLLLANIFYFIEKYHRQSIKLEKLQDNAQ